MRSGPFALTNVRTVYRVAYRRQIARLVDLAFRGGRDGRGLPARFDEGGELDAGCGVHAGLQVLVGVHREAGVGVSQPLGDHHDRDTGGDEQRRVSVP
jgi:hypothetical protein